MRGMVHGPVAVVQPHGFGAPACRRDGRSTVRPRSRPPAPNHRPHPRRWLCAPRDLE